MTWNHRVVKTTYRHDLPGEEDQLVEVQYAIHEAHYNDAGELVAVTEHATPAWAETPEGLRITLDRQLRALEKPIIDMDTQVWAKDDDMDSDEEEASNLESSE